LASWLVAAKTTDNLRDCRLVALAGVLPDADGLGVVVDIISSAIADSPTQLYARYHHYVLHGACGAVLVAGILACFAHRPARVWLLCLITFHLHLLFDLAGSRGPDPEDLWPIWYLGPFTRHIGWVWKGQWRLDGWQNYALTIPLLIWALALGLRKGHTFVGVFSQWADAIFVKVLRGWRDSIFRPLRRQY